MSATSSSPSDYPPQIRVGGEHARAVYVRRPDHYAVHGRRRSAAAPDAVLLLDDGAIAVFRESPGAATERGSRPAAPADDVGPVYALHPDGPLAVPTGLVFARFADDVTAESRQEELRHAGYDVVEILPYAPNAAWLRARAGGIAGALAHLPALQALPGMESVEPQMLMERTRRA